MSSSFDRISTIDPRLKQLFQGLAGSYGSGQGLNLQQNPLFQSGQNYLQNLLSGSPESSQAFEAPIMRQFQEQILPQLAERFAGMGGGGQSSAFQQALGKSGADLSERLAALRAGLQQGAAGQALQYAQQPYENATRLLGMNTQNLIPKERPWWQDALTGITGGLAQGAGLGLTGGLGGLAGMFRGGQPTYNNRARSYSGGQGITNTYWGG